MILLMVQKSGDQQLIGNLSYYLRRVLYIAGGFLAGILNHQQYLGVSKNRGTPKSSILIGFSIINHPFWGTPIFGNTHLSVESTCRIQVNRFRIARQRAGLLFGP